MSQAKTTSWIYKFLLLGTIWGSSFLFISFGLDALTPTGIAFWRSAIGALTLLLVLLVLRIKLVRGWSAWVKLWIAGLFMSAMPAVLFGYAQQHVTSALAAILNASTPIFTVIAILIAFRAEKPKPEVLVGLAVGLLGVFVVLGIWDGFGENEPLAIGALILAVTCYGIGSPFLRKYVEPLNLKPEAAVFGQVLTSAITLLPFYLTGALFVGPLGFSSVASMLALGILGTGLAYVMYYRLLAQVGSAIGSAVTYMSPIVGVILGVLLLGEQITWNEPIGAAVILFGAAVAQGRIRLGRIELKRDVKN
ncbi:DMT family transporter [Rhodoluna lacicola]|uniref:Permeases of the drug/metabolite transporter (DMT) superfamily n=1 Tax=Rhodoluna lacicola TaxID=529884 RepID=A0A060JEA0_9MICO|nr:DMT family transporter [Rhodoluna lacicola]AIC47085.1 Permeases of the drug/metabolite transporter (DMT) superfamily [Rhodoluna lacicola]